MTLTDKQKIDLLRKKNVIKIVEDGTKFRGGAAIGSPAIVVTVTRKVPLDKLSKKDIVPVSINELPTDVVEGKEIKALNVDRTTRFRPAPGGVSIGHPDITAGTLGMWVRRNGVWGILSNNHVMGNLNEAKIGDPIYQPGPYHGGEAKDTIAHLAVLPLIDMIDVSNCPIAKSIVNPLNFIARILGRKTRLTTTTEVGTNLVDCAWAERKSIAFVDPIILEIGEPEGECVFAVGDDVRESGIILGLTFGVVTSITASANVGMGDGRVAMFTDQIEIGTPGFSAPGHSGSSILHSLNFHVGGLLFAGNDDMTLACKYANVKAALGLDTITGE